MRYFITEWLIREYKAMASKEEMKKQITDQIKQLELELKAIDDLYKQAEDKDIPYDDRKSAKQDK
jgi:hypothetical protein